MTSTLISDQPHNLTASFRSRRPRATRLAQRYLWPVGCAVSAALLAGNLIATHFTRGYNSDDVGLQTIVSEWARGYHGTATVGSDNFILKVPLYLLLGQLFHKGRSVLLLTALILNIAGFVLLAVSLRYFAQRLGAKKEVLVLPLLWLASLGTEFVSILMTPNLRNIELGIAFASLMLVAKYADGQLAARPGRLICYLLGLGLFLYNDPYFLYFLVVPLLLLLVGIALVREQPNRLVLRLIAFLVGGIAVSQLVDVVARAFGFEAERGEIGFISLDQLGRHVELLVQGLLTLFRADFFSQRVIGFATVHALLGLAVLLAVLAFPFLSKRVEKEGGVPWRWFFGLLPAFIASGFVLSTQTVDVFSTRYLVLVPFTGVLLMALLFHAAKPRVQRLGAAVLLLAIATNVISSVHAFSRPPGGPNASNYVILDAVRMSGLTKGYATYRSSNINTFLSGDRIDFIQVECVAPRLRPYAWLNDDAILRKPAHRSFYLYESGSGTLACSRDEVVRQFGEPAEARPINATTELMVYDYDLAATLGVKD